MTDDGIDGLKEEIDNLHARLDAQRAIFTVIITAIGDTKPGALEHIIDGLASFEHALRMTNERDVVLQELRDVRETVERVGRSEAPEADE